MKKLLKSAWKRLRYPAAYLALSYIEKLRNQPTRNSAQRWALEIARDGILDAVDPERGTEREAAR